MEFADKGDLFQKITHFKRMGYYFDEMDIWKIFIQMTKGLKALHDLKILHRDLKSANIFLFSDGTAKIGDLNVSKVAKKGIGYTQTGTPYYASPEVWEDKPYDSKSDVWSLACVTYEMLTLHPPFRAESMKGLYEKVIKGKYPKINERYSSDISDLLKLLFKLNPKDRPSCGEILKNPIVVKRMEFLKSGASDDNIDLIEMDENALLKTIRIPKNLLFLSNKLPKANYESSSDNNMSTAENTKEVKKTIIINNNILPVIKKLNNRYLNINTENNSITESKKPNLNLITDSSNNQNDITQEKSINSLKPTPRNISLSPINKINKENKLNIISNNIKQRRIIMPYYHRAKNIGGNKGLNELYKLYVSNDYKNPYGKNSNNIGLYLPNVYKRKYSNGERSNNNSHNSNIINSKKN
jgi:NIMA (never in mitosis gene a)-related kinase